ncbi:hypothetical protein CVT25_015041 [Psilocybe cyanescens]|uniref:Zn(2)-C6 fungal-type domain-containing protein n=1 Tax=Psilocybe cyanescens TaxID=93625 RepID=A0A409VPQ4_PSICY|nr:hypothetical protein CVT25_015041 [Psilocybe cyanescens]
MYAESPPASSSYSSPPLTPFQDYQRERQQQFYRVFPDARYHDSIWGPPQYTTTTYDINQSFGGPVFQYDSSLTSSGLDRGYTAVETGALQSRPAEVASQYSTRAYYEYSNTGLEPNQSDLGTSHEANLQSGHYYTPTSPDPVSYYPEQSNTTPSYTVPSQQLPPAYYTQEQQFPNGQSETPSVETHYVPSYNQHANYEHAYPNTVNQSEVGSLVDVHSPTRHPYYQSESTTELAGSPPHSRFSEDIPESVIPMPVEMSDTQLSNRKETQIPAPPPAMARRRPSEALRSNKTINHEPESLPNNSSSGSRGAAGQHRLEHRHPRSLSRIPSQAPNSPNPSGTAWMGPLPGPPLPPSRPSMPLSPLPTKRQLEKKPPLACLFCRGRKIACGPPVPGSTNKTCNQCQRRSLPCEYPTESRRGMRKKKLLDSVETVNKDASTASPSADAD